MCTLQLGHASTRGVPSPGHCLFVAPGLLPLMVGERRLRHERPQPGVLGRLGEHSQLLLDDGELLASLHESSVNLGETPLDGLPLHKGSVGRLTRRTTLTLELTLARSRLSQEGHPDHRENGEAEHDQVDGPKRVGLGKRAWGAAARLHRLGELSRSPQRTRQRREQDLL